jgi:hypothetical protein
MKGGLQPRVRLADIASSEETSLKAEAGKNSLSEFDLHWKRIRAILFARHAAARTSSIYRSSIFEAVTLTGAHLLNQGRKSRSA